MVDWVDWAVLFWGGETLWYEMWVPHRVSLCRAAEMPVGPQDVGADRGWDCPPVTENHVWVFLCHTYMVLATPSFTRLITAPLLPPLLFCLTVCLSTQAGKQSALTKYLLKAWMREQTSLFYRRSHKAQGGRASRWESWDKQSGLLGLRRVRILSAFLCVRSVLGSSPTCLFPEGKLRPREGKDSPTGTEEDHDRARPGTEICCLPSQCAGRRSWIGPVAKALKEVTEPSGSQSSLSILSLNC